MNQVVIKQVEWREQRQALMAIRLAVFVEEQGVPLALEQDEFDAQAIHLLATTPLGLPVATARLLDDGRIGRMAVLPGWRNQGVGSAMLTALIRIAGERGDTRLVLHAQCRAEAFYQRHGFAPNGEIFEEAGIDHRCMSMTLDGQRD